jgi:hypothetical protein
VTRPEEPQRAFPGPEVAGAEGWKESPQQRLDGRPKECGAAGGEHLQTAGEVISALGPAAAATAGRRLRPGSEMGRDDADTGYDVPRD